MRSILFFVLILFFLLPNKHFPIHHHPDENEFLVTVQKMPVLIGGYELLQKRVKYPEAARTKAIEGKVYILAYILETGECVDAKIVRGIGYGCDEESIKAVLASKFIPGENNSVKVKSKLILAINFKLNY